LGAPVANHAPQIADSFSFPFVTEARAGARSNKFGDAAVEITAFLFCQLLAFGFGEWRLLAPKLHVRRRKRRWNSETCQLFDDWVITGPCAEEWIHASKLAWIALQWLARDVDNGRSAASEAGSAGFIAWRSFTEQYLDSTGIFKDAVISIMATIAKQENIRRSERIRAGLARTKAQYVLWYPAHQHHIRQRFDHLQTPQAPRHPQRQTFPRILVDHHQDA
jgi:hypothetical protein